MVRRSKLGGLACLCAAWLALAACGRDPRIEERPVVVYAPRSCPVSQDRAFSVIYAGGDFEPREERPPIASLFLREVGAVMGDLPPGTRSLVVDVSQPQPDVDWRGVAEVPSKGPVNVLVWPGGESCRLSRDVEARTDMTFGVFGRHFLVAGGRGLEGAQVPNTYVGDLSTGIVERLEFGLATRRAHATVTAFHREEDGELTGALIAGGQDPDTDTPLGTAETYAPKLGTPGDIGDFDGTRIELSEPRTRHGAVVLGSGETLLVGGVGQSGTPTRLMEIVDPRTGRSRTSGVALLAVPRSSPTVLRLASGEILVAGGLDRSGNPVPTLEWFAPDASRATKRPIDLVTGRERAFVPLEAGGALAVIAPRDDTPDFKTVWVISAEGTLEPGVPVDPKEIAVVRLFPGAEGAPVLWTGRRWLRWQPWFGAFQPIAAADERGPASAAIASGDSGLALWLSEEPGMFVRGFRFATRTRFAGVPKPLLADGPGQLAPDRLAGLPGSSIRWSQDRGLELGPGASAFLTDVTFADFRVEVDVTSSAPVVVLRQEDGRELDVGGAACAAAQAAARKLVVERTGRRVDVWVDEAARRTCPTELDAADVRVSIGLRGGQGVISGARNLRVTRR